MRLFAFVLYMLFLPVLCAAQDQVRVAIMQDAASFSLKITGFYELKDCQANKVLYRGKGVSTTVTASRDAIFIAGRALKVKCAMIKVEDTGSLTIDDRLFRGDIRIIRKDNAALLVINGIDLEDYIRGILYHEVSHYWPQDALDAQAVVCRTYAVYQMMQNKQKDFDVTSDIYSQVYGGKTSERYRTNAAVDDTRGQVIMFNGKIIPAYFHATCAGHTEDAEGLWGIDLAPLKGVKCGYCKDSPHFRWHNVITLEEIEEKLADSGRAIKGIKEIKTLGRDASGRVTQMVISSDKKTVKISAKDFRSILGPNVIRSTNFTVSIAQQDAVFEGFGWGHGVGLCQWGAYFMAKSGSSYVDIIKFYYPGTEIKCL